jgi:hypothetical protein
VQRREGICQNLQMALCPFLHSLRLDAVGDAPPVSSLLSSVEDHCHRGCEDLLTHCFGDGEGSAGSTIDCFSGRDVASLAHGIKEAVVPAGGTLDDFLQLVPLGDKRTLGLLVIIDKIVDKVPDFTTRVQMLRKAEKRAHLLFPASVTGSSPASNDKIQALKAVIHAEIALLDPHVLDCKHCILLHRWRSWAHSFVLLLPAQIKVESVDPSALAAHSLLSMISDDSLDCDKDQAEGVATFFTHLFFKKEAAETETPGKVLGGLLKYIEGVVREIKPFDAEGARKASSETSNPGIDAAEALPAQLQAALGKDRSFEGINAVSFRAMLRLAIVFLGKIAKHFGEAAAEEAWNSWFPTGPGKEAGDLGAVLSLPEESLVAADAEAMKSAMAAPSIATDKAVLKVLLTASDEELGENPSPMTLMWMAACDSS